MLICSQHVSGEAFVRRAKVVLSVTVETTLHKTRERKNMEKNNLRFLLVWAGKTES